MFSRRSVKSPEKKEKCAKNPSLSEAYICINRTKNNVTITKEKKKPNQSI